MSNPKRLLAAALLAGAGIALMANPVSAMPAAPGVALQKAAPNQVASEVQTVRWGGHWGRGRGWGIGGGFIAGAIIGGALAAPYYYGPGPYYYGGPYYYAPGPYYPAPGYYGPAPAGDAVAYCMRRFRSYDPRSGTYLGLDGLRHPCP